MYGYGYGYGYGDDYSEPEEGQAVSQIDDLRGLMRRRRKSCCLSEIGCYYILESVDLETVEWRYY